MWLTALSVRRPLVVLMIISALLAIGFVSWSRLAIDLFPRLDSPVVTVTTVYTGAGPETIDILVTKKIEDAVASMSDIDYIQSSSFEATSSVMIVFTDRAGKDAAVEVERRVNAIRDQLPTDVKAPTVGKFNFATMPIVSLALSGTRDLGQLQELAEDKIQKRLESAPGVAQVSLVGGLQREIQVHVDQRKLQARGLSILQVNQALTNDNLNVPAGSLTDAGRDYTVRLNTQARTPADLNPLLIAATPGGPVYLRDVATVVDTYKKQKQIQRFNGESALGITIAKQATANSVETADAIRKVVRQLERDLPPDVKIDVVSDASIFTRNSLADLQQSLSEAVLLTGLVLLVFLHTLRSTLIVLVAIPTSLIATLGFMYFYGFSLNMMSMMGLALTIGILVDDSIVVLDNIFRHLHLGEEPKIAAMNGRSEIGFAAIAITLVDVVVFTPVAFMTGWVGQWFREFGLVITTATLFSLFVSFTLTPMLASRWYRAGETGEIVRGRPSRNPLARFAARWDESYGRLERAYARLLARALRRRWLVVAIGFASFVAGIALVATGILSTEFMREADEGRVQVSVEMPPGTSLERTDLAARRLEAELLSWPEVAKVFTSVGIGGETGFGIGTSQARFARIAVELTKKHQRHRSARQIADAARTLGAELPGAVVKANAVGSFGGAAAPIQILVRGEDSKVLTALAQEAAAVVRNVRGTADVSDGGVSGQPELVMNVDRGRAAELGLTPGEVASVLRTGLTGTTVSAFRPQGTKSWDVTVILDPNERRRVDQVLEIPVLAPNGSMVRVGQLAQVTTTSGPTQVDRRDRERTVIVTASLAGRPLGDVGRDIQAGLTRIDVPAGYRVTQGGDVQEQVEAFGQIFQTLGLSVLLMYMLMVALFESLVFPLIVMLSLPLAIVGAFGLLVLAGNSLNMMSMIGLILLTGLVGKNAILLVDYTNTLRRRGLGRHEALLQAGPTRLRPILMTTAAIILAMLPIALAVGEGSEWRAPMGLTVIGGLITSTLLTLVFVPSVYTIMDDFQGVVARAPERLPGLFRRRVTAPVPATDGHEELRMPPAPRIPVPAPVRGGSE